MDEKWYKTEWNKLIVEESYFNNIDTDIWQLEKDRDYSFIERYISKDMRVLDLGCGLGKMAEMLHDKVKEYYGVDISDGAIEICKKRNQDKKNAFFFSNNGFDLRDFDDNYFDFVFSIVTFQHIKRDIIIGYLKEIVRVLKDDGNFALQFLNKMYYHTDAFYDNLEKTTEEKTWKFGGSIASFSPEEINFLFNELNTKCQVMIFEEFNKGKFSKLNPGNFPWLFVVKEKK